MENYGWCQLCVCLFVFLSRAIISRKTGLIWMKLYYSSHKHTHIHSFIQSSRLLEEHKAPTSRLQAVRSWASQRSSLQVLPAAFISSSMVLLQVPSGLPLFRFPGGAQDSASRGCRPFFMRRTWPSHVQRLLFTSKTMLPIPVCLQISSLLTQHHLLQKDSRRQKHMKRDNLQKGQATQSTKTDINKTTLASKKASNTRRRHHSPSALFWSVPGKDWSLQPSSHALSHPRVMSTMVIIDLTDKEER